MLKTAAYAAASATSPLAPFEIIPMAGIGAAYERMLKSDVRYRFVIDMATLRK